MKNLSVALNAWQKKKSRAEVEIQKAASNKFAAPVTDNLNQLLAHGKKKADELDEISKTIQVKGRCHYSKAQLHEHMDKMKEVFRIEKDVTNKLAVLAHLNKIKVPPPVCPRRVQHKSVLAVTARPFLQHL